MNDLTRENTIYTPTDNELELLKEYFELWKGLPDVEFEPTKSRGGLPALKFFKDNDYIWVADYSMNHDTPKTVFSALIDKCGDYTKAIYVKPVWPADASGVHDTPYIDLPDAAACIEHCKNTNTKTLIEDVIEKNFNPKARKTMDPTDLAHRVINMCNREGIELDYNFTKSFVKTYMRK